MHTRIIAFFHFLSDHFDKFPMWCVVAVSFVTVAVVVVDSLLVVSSIPSAAVLSREQRESWNWPLCSVYIVSCICVLWDYWYCVQGHKCTYTSKLPDCFHFTSFTFSVLHRLCSHESISTLLRLLLSGSDREPVTMEKSISINHLF